SCRFIMRNNNASPALLRASPGLDPGWEAGSGTKTARQRDASAWRNSCDSTRQTQKWQAI
ncbi:MAG: hypothetical protein WAN11_00880, partial [Syntrophobacteraceae bacterium]